MNPLTATELDLLACFAVEPALRDAGVPWEDNHATYDVDVDGSTVRFAIEPGGRQVWLTVRRAGQRVVELTANSFTDLRVVEGQPGRDALEVQLSESGWLLIQVRPTVELIQAHGGPD